jgi:hypothetical protein
VEIYCFIIHLCAKRDIAVQENVIKFSSFPGVLNKCLFYIHLLLLVSQRERGLICESKQRRANNTCLPLTLTGRGPLRRRSFIAAAESKRPDRRARAQLLYAPIMKKQPSRVSHFEFVARWYLIEI